MIQRFISYGGYDWTSAGYHAALPFDSAHGAWGTAYDEYERPGAHPALGGGAVGVRRIAVDFTFADGTSAATIYNAFHALMGNLQPDAPHDPENPRYLVAELADGSSTQVRVPAVIERPHEPTPNQGRNGFLVTFLATDPAWRLVTPLSASHDAIGRNRLAPYNPSFAVDLTGWSQDSITAGLTVVVTRDATVFDDEAGSLKIAVNANAAGVGATVVWRNDAYLPVTPGADYTVAYSATSTEANLTPRFSVNWYDDEQAFLDFSAEADWTPTPGTWSRRRVAVTAPAGAAFARIFPYAYADVAGATGVVWFDRLGFSEDEPATWDALAVANAGSARAWPVLTLIPIGQAPGDLPYRYRRTMVVANHAEQDLAGEAVMVPLGDTSAWVDATDGADADGANVWAFRDGVEVPRELVGFGQATSYAWLYLDHLARDSFAVVEFVYGGDGPAATGLTGAYRPAFDVSSAVVTTAAGSTTTAIEVAGVSWYTDQWANARVIVETGALAGEGAVVTGNDADTLTVFPALTGAIGAGETVLVHQSAADWLVYNVRQVDHDGAARGLWHLDQGETRPADVRYDAPGAWEPFLFLDNTDEKNQSDYLGVDVGGGNRDYFAVLDADRAGQGVSNLQNSGAADGVRFASAFPILTWQFDGAFKNPNGMCHGFFGGRASEARDWTEVRDVTTATDATTLTAFAVETKTLDAGTRHLCAAVLPIDDESISPDWARITGSRTAGGAAGTATVTDGAIAGDYEDDQFNQGTMVVTGGTGAGQKRTVTDFNGSSGQFTLSSNWSVSLDDTSRFEVANKTLVATLRSNTTWMLTRDMADLVVADVAAEEPNYPADLVVRVDGGAAGATRPFYRLRVGQADRLLFATGPEDRLELDCPNRRARIVWADGSVIRDVTAYVVAEYVDADGTAWLADEWLPMPPGAHTLYVLPTGLTTYDLEATLAAGYLG